MTAENEIEAVVAEVIRAARLGSKGPDMKSTAAAAARLLLAARRERDEARALRGMGSELAAQSTSTLKEVARLTAERDEARREAKTLWEDRDEVMQTVTALRAERDEAWDRIRELDIECAHWHAEYDEARADAAWWQKTHANDAGAMAAKWRQATTERDAATRTLDEAKDAFARHVDELQQELTVTRGAMMDFRQQRDDLQEDHDAMAAEIKHQYEQADLEQGHRMALRAQLNEARAQAADCHAKWLDEAEKRRKLLETEAELRESIQTWQQTAHEVGQKYAALSADLEARLADADLCAVLETSCTSCAKLLERMHGLEERGAENERLRTAFEDADWTFCTCEACQHNEGVLGDLAAALDEPKA